MRQGINSLSDCGINLKLTLILAIYIWIVFMNLKNQRSGLT
jgi:hypothetical protein